jgi:hypothetical protein
MVPEWERMYLLMSPSLLPKPKDVPLELSMEGLS